MRLQARDLLEMFGALTVAKKSSGNHPLEFSVLVARNWRILRPEVELIDEKRQELLNQVARKDDEGHNVRDTNGQTFIQDFEAWEKGLRALDRLEFEVNLYPISEALLKGLSPEIVTGLVDLIDE